MDFVVAGFGFGSIAVLAGMLVAQRGAFWRRGSKREAAALAAESNARAAGRALAVGGGIVILLTVVGLAFQQSDRPGTLLVLAGIALTIAATAVAALGFGPRPAPRLAAARPRPTLRVPAPQPGARRPHSRAGAAPDLPPRDSGALPPHLPADEGVPPPSRDAAWALELDALLDQLGPDADEPFAASPPEDSLRGGGNPSFPRRPAGAPATFQWSGGALEDEDDLDAPPAAQRPGRD